MKAIVRFVKNAKGEDNHASHIIPFDKIVTVSRLYTACDENSVGDVEIDEYLVQTINGKEYRRTTKELQGYFAYLGL